MSINHAILGMLSYRELTGYDLKKIIQDSSFMHWSGNNNQIYKSLTELLAKGMVTNVVRHQESAPTKKVYMITDRGLAALKEWVLSEAEPMEIKKPFLVQLACSRQLNTGEMNIMLDGYENQVKMQLLMAQKGKQDITAGGNALEAAIWSLINDNIRRTFENELGWLQDLRKAIAHIPNENDVKADKAGENTAAETSHGEKGHKSMKYTVNSYKEIRYVHFNEPETKLETERNILDVIGALVENDIQFALFDSEVLSRDFLELKKGLAGALLQKFAMYRIKSAIVVKGIDGLDSKFMASISESAKHNIVKVFTDTADAEKWFLSRKQNEGL
ncbi:transcriptional regulator PadR-like family protein [Ruminiclostridium hungatei]|uniref:Transcriptional regulator PadR-like family protein n=1 Tax=Ruminiclostridium hungatei TaxID=48256 RepID=A0A1V4SML2_RUMHU|nr:DUF4180 domain-containing protein [Ruminiclostridium hungatei]OPX45129.1 transcriptional regulator PadR-like family protein [Ruminiclostridium hungatei]